MDCYSLSVEGFVELPEQDFSDFWQMLDREKLTFVASKRAPCGLQEQIEELLSIGMSIDSGHSEVKPSAVWGELIRDGLVELMKRWRGTPATDVDDAFRLLVIDDDHSSYHDRHEMFKSFTSDRFQIPIISLGHSRVLAFVDSNLELKNDEDQTDIQEICDEWGFDFGDFCCLCAGVALLKNEDVDELCKHSVREHIDAMDEYVRLNGEMVRGYNSISPKVVVFSRFGDTLHMSGSMVRW